MRAFFMALALAIAVSGCGARTEPLSATTDHAPGPLQILVTPIDDLFQNGASWAAVRVVARSQGFDLLAVTEGAPFAIEARRAAVSTSPLALDFAGDTGPLISDMLDSFEAEASGERLTLCHNHATPTRSSSRASPARTPRHRRRRSTGTGPCATASRGTAARASSS